MPIARVVKTLLCSAALLAASAALPPVYAQETAPAPSVDVAAATARVCRSLVSVEYLLRNENDSQEQTGQGIVVHKDGVILIAGGLIPENLPREWIKELKIRLPGAKFTTVPATLLGRTQNRLFAFVKAEKPIDAPPLDLSNTAEVALGQQVFSAALLPKSGGYEPYVGVNRVKAILRTVHQTASTESFGLARPTSPVYDLKTGTLVGITTPYPGESMTMVMSGNNGETRSFRVLLNDEEQNSTFLLASDLRAAVPTIPTAPFESPRPWLGIDGITGLEEDLRAAYGISESAGVMIGSIIPDQTAAKAGLESKDVILTINGKAFSDSSVPEFMVLHFQRAMERFKVGDKVTFGILRDGNRIEKTATLAALPKLGAEMPQTFNAKIGISTRDLVFMDLYGRKLPPEQKGVLVSLVKNGSPAALGQTRLLPGDLITKVNDEPVSDAAQFANALKTALSEANRKEVIFVVIRHGETSVCRIELK